MAAYARGTVSQYMELADEVAFVLEEVPLVVWTYVGLEAIRDGMGIGILVGAPDPSWTQTAYTVDAFAECLPHPPYPHLWADVDLLGVGVGEV